MRTAIMILPHGHLSIGVESLLFAAYPLMLFFALHSGIRKSTLSPAVRGLCIALIAYAVQAVVNIAQPMTTPIAILIIGILISRAPVVESRSRRFWRALQAVIIDKLFCPVRMLPQRRSSLSSNSKQDHPFGWSFRWRPRRDSNARPFA